LTRYPKFANDIREYAAKAWDLEARKCLPQKEPDKDVLSRAQSRMLNALHNAREAARHEEAAEPAKTFDDVLKARNVDMVYIADEVKIKRKVISYVLGGRVHPPIGTRLLRRLLDVLGLSPKAFDAALQHALAAPRLGHAKSEGVPTVSPLSYEDLIRSSGMSPEEIEYWLADE
jgi:hypothetical protein